MEASYDNSAAVVVLPPISGQRLKDKSLRVWLAQANLARDSVRQELLARILSVVGLPYPRQGLGALRMWGQTRDRPTVWIAAADPVYLEPRLDNLCLHALRRVGVPPADMRALIDHLQTTLADDTRFGFARLGSCSYLRAEAPLATASVPAYVVDQQSPNDYLPGGNDAAAFLNLQSEIEMALHDHEVNQRRVAAGQKPVNSLWLWGGGMAPERQVRAQPPLFANESLLLGYWESATAPAELWPGRMADCIETSVSGFVAVTPENEGDPAFLVDCLQALRAAIRSGQIRKLTLLFRDGLRADIERSQALRFWRRDSPLLDEVSQ